MNIPEQETRNNSELEIKRKLDNKNVVFWTLLALYFSFSISFLCALIPVSSASIFSLMLCICIIGGLYTYRVRAKKAKNIAVIRHTTHIIRTFWRAILLLIVTLFIAFLYMLVIVDYHPVEKCLLAIEGALEKGHFRVLSTIFKSCGYLIFEENKMHLQIAGLIAFIPVFVYVLVRCSTGSIFLLLYRHTIITRNNARQEKYKG